MLFRSCLPKPRPDRFIGWIILVFLFAKILGVVLESIRPWFRQSAKPDVHEEKKQAKRDYPNVQDADFEDITDKK